MERICIFSRKHHIDNRHDVECSLNETMMMKVMKLDSTENERIRKKNKVQFDFDRVLLEFSRNFHFHYRFRQVIQRRNRILQNTMIYARRYFFLFLLLLPVIVPSLLKIIRRLLRTIRLIDDTLGNLSAGQMPSFCRLSRICQANI